MKYPKLVGMMALTAGIAAAGAWYGNRTVGLTPVEVTSPRLPESFSGFTIAQVSDLHNAELGKENSRLLKQLRRAQPDVIAITGDLIDSRHTKVEPALQFVENARKIAPVLYIPGNHESRVVEYRELRKGLEKLGIPVLHNRQMFWTKGGETIRFVGMADPDFRVNGGDSRSREDIAAGQLGGFPKDRHFTVLLSHRPELFPVYAAFGADLTLSGHAHGGQIRLPAIGGLFAPGQGILPAYTDGLYRMGQAQMVVSRGIGPSKFPLRVRNRPEIKVITLQKACNPSSDMVK